MKQYLGDGVYGEIDAHGCVVLTTEDGIRTTNSIVLEPEVLTAFQQWVVLAVALKRIRAVVEAGH